MPRWKSDKLAQLGIILKTSQWCTLLSISYLDNSLIYLLHLRLQILFFFFLILVVVLRPHVIFHLLHMLYGIAVDISYICIGFSGGIDHRNSQDPCKIFSTNINISRNRGRCYNMSHSKNQRCFLCFLSVPKTSSYIKVENWLFQKLDLEN